MMFAGKRSQSEVLEYGKEEKQLLVIYDRVWGGDMRLDKSTTQNEVTEIQHSSCYCIMLYSMLSRRVIVSHSIEYLFLNSFSMCICIFLISQASRISYSTFSSHQSQSSAPVDILYHSFPSPTLFNNMSPSLPVFCFSSFQIHPYGPLFIN